MRTWMLVMIAIAALGLAAWLLLRGAGRPAEPSTDHVGRPRRTVPAPPTPDLRAARPSTPPPATSPSGAPTGGGDLPAPQRPRGAIDHGRAWASLPPSYPTKATSATSVAVNLSGEPVSVYVGGAAADPSPLVELRGRVVEAGQPVAGITVVVAERFMVMFAHLSAQGSAVTDADGRFAVSAVATARWALALGPHSWSALTPIAAGTEATLELAPQPAGLEVTVREDGAPLGATLTLIVGAGTMSGTVSAPDGVFRFAALPPGPARFDVGASLEFASGGDDVPPVAVTLVAGQVVRRTIELDSNNATVAVVPVVGEGLVARTVEFALLPPPAPATLADLRARAGGMPLFGGRDAANTYQFHRITPAGARVACAVGTLHHTSGPAAPEVRWGCVPVDVPATGVVEVEVPIDRPSP